MTTTAPDTKDKVDTAQVAREVAPARPSDLPVHHRDGVARSAAVGRLYVAPPVFVDGGERLCLDRRRVQLPELHRRFHPGRDVQVLRQHADHHGPRRDPHAAPRVDGRIRARAIQLQIQPHHVDAVHGREPASAAGDHHPAVSHVSRDAVAELARRERHLLRQLLRDHRHPHRVPDGVLYVRALELLQVAATRSQRGSVRGRSRRSGVSTGTSSCRWHDHRWRPSPCSSSPGSTTTSSGLSC